MSGESIPHRRLKTKLSIMDPGGRPVRSIQIGIELVPKGTAKSSNAWYINDKDMEPYKPIPISPHIAFQHSMEAEGDSVIIGEVGFCIYCGSPLHHVGSTQPCSDEHVIPKGLGGKLIIKKASCQNCADAVNSFEGNLLRNLFNVPRRSMSIRGRSRVPHPINIATFVGDREVETQLPEGMHPSDLLMPSLYLPQMLTFNREALQGVQKIWCRRLNDKRSPHGSGGVNNYITPELDFLKFGQLLAKIAYCYSMSFSTISAFSIPGREPIVNSKITPLARFAATKFPVDQYPLGFYDFVGGFTERFEPDTKLHKIGRGTMFCGGFTFEVVYIWLFASIGAPVYCVITDCDGFERP